jgi:hypothetical protein
VSRIGIGVPGKQFAAEGGYGNSDDDGDPSGEEEPSGIEEKCVDRHEGSFVKGAPELLNLDLQAVVRRKVALAKPTALAVGFILSPS